jgi:hypothetical protein
VPISSWQRGPLKEWAIATLKNGRLEADHARAIWTLLVLGEWLDWVATETDCGQATEATMIFSMIPDTNLLERHFSIHL